MKAHERAVMMEEIGMSFAFAAGPTVEMAPASSRVFYRTDHLPQPCSHCISAGPGYSGWLHSICAERHWRITRINELNLRRV